MHLICRSSYKDAFFEVFIDVPEGVTVFPLSILLVPWALVEAKSLTFATPLFSIYIYKVKVKCYSIDGHCR